MNPPIYLVNPSTEMVERDRPISAPLGICSLAGYLREKGLENIVLDDGYLMGLNGKDSTSLVKRRISELKPLIFGTSVYSGAHISATELLRFAHDSGCITVAGGVDATLNHMNYAKSGFIDYVIRGEGEEAFHWLLDSILMGKGKKSNLTYSNGKLNIIPDAPLLDMDTLPFPAIDLLPDFSKYSQGRSLGIEESRGCSYDCSFCAIKETNKKIRLKSPRRIEQELDHCVDKYEPSNIRFVSENVLLTERRANEIAQVMSKYSIPWMLNAHPRLLNARVLEIPSLVRSGLHTLEIGIESGSDNVLKLFNKSTTTGENDSALRALNGSGIPELRIEYIMFNPLMSHQDLIDSFGFIEDHLQIFSSDPKFPKQLFTEMYVEEGTRFFRILNENGLLTESGNGPIKRSFRTHYADKKVESIKEKAMALSHRIRGKHCDLQELMGEYRHMVHGGGK